MDPSKASHSAAGLEEKEAPVAQVGGPGRLFGQDHPDRDILGYITCDIPEYSEASLQLATVKSPLPPRDLGLLRTPLSGSTRQYCVFVLAVHTPRMIPDNLD